MELVLLGLGAAALAAVVGIFGLGYMPLIGAVTFWSALLPTVVGAVAIGVMIGSGENCLDNRQSGWPMNHQKGVTSFLVGAAFLTWPIICFQGSRLAVYFNHPTAGLWLHRIRFWPSSSFGVAAVLILVGIVVVEPIRLNYRASKRPAEPVV